MIIYKESSYFIYYDTCVYHEDDMLSPCGAALNMFALQGGTAQGIGDVREGFLAVVVRLQHRKVTRRAVRWNKWKHAILLQIIGASL